MEILQKSIPIESMLKSCTVFKYYDLNPIEKSKVAGKALTSFPIAEVLSYHSIVITFILKFYTYEVRGYITHRDQSLHCGVLQQLIGDLLKDFNSFFINDI